MREIWAFVAGGGFLALAGACAALAPSAGGIAVAFLLALAGGALLISRDVRIEQRIDELEFEIEQKNIDLEYALPTADEGIAQMTTLDQTRAIHATRRQIAEFTEEDYRALLRERFGVSTSTRLTFVQAAGLIAELKKLAGKNARRDGAHVVMSGPFARALQALWIAAWNLGVVEDRHDRALLAFVRRQTGLDHTRFLNDPKDGAKAVEGLKAWIAREAGVEWPASKHAIERKHAIVDAQAEIVRRTLPTFSPQKLGKLEGLGASLAAYDERALDKLSMAIGKMIRRQKADQRKRRAA